MESPFPRATAHLLRRLGEEKVVTPDQAAALERLLRERLPWRHWAERVLLAVGAALLLAGVIFFFAYNWSSLPPAAKFATVESGLLLGAIAAWRLGLDELGGRIALFACCVLTGVFLAVHGQIYQTGADTWLLFAAWALLIFAWVLFARFAALWVFWLILLHFAIILAWKSWGSVRSIIELLCLLALLETAALATREVFLRRGSLWLDEGWVRALLLVSIFGGLTFGSCLFIVSEEHEPLALFLLVGLGVGAYWVYRRWLPSQAALAVIVLSGATVLTAGINRVLLQPLHDAVGTFFLMSIVVLAIFGGAVWWLRKEGARLRALHPEGTP